MLKWRNAEVERLSGKMGRVEGNGRFVRVRWGWSREILGVDYSKFPTLQANYYRYLQ